MNSDYKSIMKRWFFTKATYSHIFTCYVIRVTKHTKHGKIRGWLFNGSMKEVWIPYKNLRITMVLYSKYLDYIDKKNGKVLIGE